MNDQTHSGHENGIVTNQTKPSAVIAIIIISIGMILLLQNFYILPIINWSKVLPYWPLLLVLLGVEFLVGRTVIIRLAVIILLSILVLFGLTKTVPSKMDIHTSLSESLERVTQYLNSIQSSEMTKTITVDPSMYQDNPITSRDITVETGAGSYELLDDQIPQFLSLHARYSNSFAEPILTHWTTDSALSIRFDLKESSGQILNASANQNYRMTIGQNTIPTAVHMTVGIGKAAVILDKTPITSLNTTVGAGSASIRLSGNSIPKDEINFSVGVGTLTVYIPKEQQIIIEYDIGLGSMIINEKHLNGKGVYISPDSHSTKPITILAHIGLGTCIIKQE